MRRAGQDAMRRVGQDAMLQFAVLVVFWGAANAIICIPGLCAYVKQVPLKCTGSIVKGGGFCGCVDICAKAEGEVCQARYENGIIPVGSCDTGLFCKEEHIGVYGAGTCVKDTLKRSAMTKCERMAYVQMMTMRNWPSKWTPACDADGNFTPLQCNFSGFCFCVNSTTGDIQTGMIHGHVDCPPD
ncbi:nidogen-2-like [Haliotis rubra]|uniref:nidogen-2-like n=1 Tax=Haliotis rubra TaxID=36100 RepID=UPI001EE5D086|nr:nidogen-2-like [Haliotis rubra]